MVSIDQVLFLFEKFILSVVISSISVKFICAVVISSLVGGWRYPKLVGKSKNKSFRLRGREMATGRRFVVLLLYEVSYVVIWWASNVYVI